MMRTSKWALGHQPSFSFDASCNRVYLGGLQCFANGHWRKYAGEAFSQHGLASSRWADKDDVMSARCGDFHAAFDAFLTSYIGKVKFGKIQIFVIFLLYVNGRTV